jgi:mannosyltransferase
VAEPPQPEAPAPSRQPGGRRLKVLPGPSDGGQAGAPVEAPARRLRAPRGPVAGGLGLTALVALSLALSVQNLGDWLWMDEGISIGIASHPLRRIPGLLVRDGSPPLYYLLLHGWMAVVGRSETSTHALSLLFALLAVPVAFWAGRSLFGAAEGWIAAALVATNPYLTYFATESRMYSLAALLALVATAAYLHVFAFGRGRHLALFVGSLTLLLYTHNWGLYLAAAAVAGLVPCAVAAADRRLLAGRVLRAFGAVGLLYLPWLPTLLRQARRTGAPWSPTPVLREAVSVVGDVLGDPRERVLVVLVVTAGVALASLLRRPRTAEAAAAGALMLLVAGTVGLGWVSSQIEPAWSPRYLAVVLPALVLLSAVGLRRSGTAGVVALVVILVIWTQPLGRLTGDRARLQLGNKSADRELAAVVRPRMVPGDLVIATQMEEVPVLRYYLGPALRYANPAGVVTDPGIADWQDASDRMAAARPAVLLPTVERIPAGGHVLLVCPSSPHASDLPWFHTMNTRCAELQAALTGSPGLRAVSVPGLAALDEGGQRVLALFERVRP